MDRTILLALLTLVMTPILICLVQNMIIRIGKKDDITLAKEGLQLQREAVIEAKRVQITAELEFILR